MPLPRHPAKHDSPALVTPEAHLAYFQAQQLIPQFAPPAAVIFVYQRWLRDHVLATEQHTAVNLLFGKLWLLDDTAGRIAVCSGFGIGAPVVVTVMELLIALGVRRFANIGMAGGLQPDARVGDLVLCDAALRDEGVSHHYNAAADDYAYPSPALTEQLGAALVAAGQRFTRGATWTTDAIYRETVAEIAHYQSQGVLTVDMEAAALFAVAAFRAVEIAAGFVISDSLASSVWEPQFSAAATHAGLEALYSATRAALTE